jgi:hypothetical protein
MACLSRSATSEASDCGVLVKLNSSPWSCGPRSMPHADGRIVRRTEGFDANLPAERRDISKGKMPQRQPADPWPASTRGAYHPDAPWIGLIGEESLSESRGGPEPDREAAFDSIAAELRASMKRSA